ncbi:MAG: hypothetical protein HYT98_01940 [Candidatus Sungbacteria bacterium]|nr:hypothetical protein [Candidatus Sungbacteria bacterium]
MDQTERERLAKKIHKEIDEDGSEINVAYIEKILEKDTVGLLLWIQDKLGNLSRPYVETVHLAQCYEQSANANTIGTLDLGTRILVSNFKTIVFILHEIQARIRAIDSPSDKQQLR